MDNSSLKEQLMNYLAGNFTCKEVAELITEYLEGSLSLKQRLLFQMHMNSCIDCRNYLSQMKYTIATLGQLPSEPVPEQVKEELLKCFWSWKQAQSSPSNRSDTP